MGPIIKVGQYYRFKNPDEDCYIKITEIRIRSIIFNWVRPPSGKVNTCIWNARRVKRYIKKKVMKEQKNSLVCIKYFE